MDLNPLPIDMSWRNPDMRLFEGNLIDLCHLIFHAIVFFLAESPKFTRDIMLAPKAKKKAFVNGYVI